MTAVLVIETIIILLLLAALIYGQPTAIQQEREHFTAVAITVSALETAQPTPTRGRCTTGYYTVC